MLLLIQPDRPRLVKLETMLNDLRGHFISSYLSLRDDYESLKIWTDFADYDFADYRPVLQVLQRVYLPVHAADMYSRIAQECRKEVL